MERHENRGLNLCIWGLFLAANLLFFLGYWQGRFVNLQITWFGTLGVMSVDLGCITAKLLSLSKTEKERELAECRKEEKDQYIPVRIAEQGQDNPAKSMRQEPTKEVLSAADDELACELRLKSYELPTIPPLRPIEPEADPLQKTLESYTCAQLLRTIGRAEKRRAELLQSLCTVQHEIAELRYFSKDVTVEEKRAALPYRERQLEKEYTRYMELYQKLTNVHIQLMSKERAGFEELRDVFCSFASSQKLAGPVPFSETVHLNCVLPGDLFATEEQAIEWKKGQYSFFLLPDVILVYKDSAVFVTALEPMSLVLKLNARRKDVQASNINSRGWTIRDSLIAKDSRLISSSAVTARWLHQRKDGGPDMRYRLSDNTRFEYRTDTYAYTELTMQIGEYKDTFYASKNVCSKEALSAVKRYCFLSHTKTEIPALLRLLSGTAEQTVPVNSLIAAYSSECRNEISAFVD